MCYMKQNTINKLDELMVITMEECGEMIEDHLKGIRCKTMIMTTNRRSW